MRRPLLHGLLAVAVAALLFAVLRGGHDPTKETVGARDPAPQNDDAPVRGLAPPAPGVPARNEVPPPADPPPPSFAEHDEQEIEELPEEEFDLPDPVQTGDCSLGLSLVDAATRLPASGTVYLWRLGAPGNENWTEGDQLQATVHVPANGALLHDLPAGAYRARCGQEADGRDDPPSFDVAGPRTDVALEITFPTPIPVYLRLFDETGWEFGEAEISMVVDGFQTKQVCEPRWRTARRPRPPNAIEVYDESRESSVDEGPWSLLRAGPDGFHVGEVTGEDRGARVTWAVKARVPGRGDVRARFSNDRVTPVHLVSVAVSREWVTERILLPDGSSARSLADSFEIEAAGLPLADANAPAPWDQVIITVRLRSHPELEDYTVHFTLRDGFPPEERLQWRSEAGR